MHKDGKKGGPWKLLEECEKSKREDYGAREEEQKPERALEGCKFQGRVERPLRKQATKFVLALEPPFIS